MTKQELLLELAQTLAVSLAKSGELIKAGFEMYERTALQGQSPEQRKECHAAFVAGAQHIFGTIVGVPDDMTEQEGAVMLDGIERELRQWHELIKSKLHGEKSN